MFAQSIPVVSDGHGGHFQSFAKSVSFSNVNGVGKEHIAQSVDGQKPMSEDFILKNNHVYSAHPQKIFAQPDFRMPQFQMPAFHMPAFHMPNFDDPERNIENEFQPLYTRFHQHPHGQSVFEEQEIKCVNGHCKGVDVHSPNMKASLFHMF